MTLGTLYGIGVGPGDPELMTVRAARLLEGCGDVFVPRARISADSTAAAIAARHLPPGARVVELEFPMTSDAAELSRRWQEAAARVVEVLRAGREACFLTLGDPMLYSTWIYLARAARALLPAVEIVTVPGITAACAAAALADFPLGEGTDTVTIVPTTDDLERVSRALGEGGTVVLMKVGRRLADVLALLERAGLREHAVFVSRAGFADQRVETDLRRLQGADAQAGYLSTILVHAGPGTKHSEEVAHS